MDKNKLILPVTILAATIILAVTILGSQMKTQRYLSWQIKIKSENDARAELAKADELKAEKVFDHYVKCQTLFIPLKQKWNNMVEIYYSEAKNNCIVKYTANGKTEEAPFEEMRDTK